MKTIKYVVIEELTLMGEAMYVFPDYIQHNEFVCNMDAEDRVVSAGFLYFSVKDDTIEVEVYGKSVSLGVESRERDTRIAQRMFTDDF